MRDSTAINIDLKGRTPPAFIAVEGPIGVGKTTLAKKLAASFNYDTLLEDTEDNPFLEKFYRNRKQAALATQLFFLFQRAQKIQDMRQADIFEPVRVADFLIEKDPLFARINLERDEFQLYEKVYQQTDHRCAHDQTWLSTCRPLPMCCYRASKAVDSLRTGHGQGLSGAPERSVQ